MSTSWKKFGGAKNLETNRKITTNTVVTDEIVLKNAFIGSFTITGVLDVNGKAYFQGGLDVSGSITSTDIETNTINVDGISNLNGDVIVGGNINAKQNMMIGNTLLVKNNLLVENNAFVAKNIFLYRDNSGNYNQYFIGDLSGIGINKNNPQYALDISTQNINGLRIQSSALTNRNIIASNSDNNGISVTSKKYNNNKTASIDFWIKNQIFTNSEGDAYIKATNEGTLEINTERDIVSLGTLAISHRQDRLYDHIFNETVVIYDASSGIYRYDIYDNSYAHYGNALTLVTDDNTSVTFMNIVTHSGNSNGLGIGGGSYTQDTSRSVGILGLYDLSTNYHQNQTIVLGNDPVKYKTTLGINTYQPVTEKYVVDINGPIHIDNGDITIVKLANFNIIKMVSSPAKDLVMAIGMPTNILDPSYGYSRILISNNYGATWTESLFKNDTNTRSSPFTPINGIYTLNDIAIYDNSYAVIVYSDISNNANVLYSRNGGIYWNIASPDSNTLSNTLNYNFNNIVIKDTPINDNSGNTIMKLYVTTKQTSSFIGLYDISLVFNDNGATITNMNNINFNNGSIQEFDYYYPNQKFYFATSTGIYSLNNNSYQLQSNTSNYYNSIRWNNNNIIAVGNNIISTSIDGLNFIDTSFNNISFTSVFIFNNFIFTIGNNNTIWMSNDSGLNWINLWNNMDSISQSGKQWLIMNPSNNFSNIIMTDANTILLSNTISTYSTSIINCFLPNLCNRSNNNVLDISGNMRINGDIHVNDNGKIISNNSDFSLINENVNSVNFAGNASQILIGNTTTGNTVIRNNLNVNLNGNILGNLSIYGQEKIHNTTDSYALNTGALIVNGGASVSKTTRLGGNLFVDKNTLIVGNLGIVSDTSLNGNLYVNSGINSSGFNSGAVVINGGIGISGNANINENLGINGNISMINGNTRATLNSLLVNGLSTFNSNINILGQEIIHNTTDSSALNTGALIVNGGASISKTTRLGGNLFVERNTLLTGNLGVISDTSLNGNLYVNSGINSSGFNSGAVVINGGIGISGNANINQNLGINGNISMINGNTRAILNSLLVNGLSTFNSNINITDGLNSTNSSTGSLVVSGGVGIGKDLYIGGTIHGVNLNTTQNITSQSTISAAQITSNTINSAPNAIMNIGNSSSIVNIGNSLNNSTIELEPNKVGISAGVDGIVTIDCSSLVVTGERRGASQILQYSSTVIMNIDQSGSQYIPISYNSPSYSTASSGGAGLWIRDFSNDTAGQFVISADLQGYIFKPTTYTRDLSLNEERDAIGKNPQISPIWNNPYFPSQNIIRLDVNKMQIYNQNQNSNLVAIIPSSDNESRYTLTSFDVDISNIMLKNKDTSFNTQSISTNLVLNGNIYHNSGSYFNDNIYSNNNAIFNNITINTQTLIPNTLLGVNGNAIISRLGIGTSSVNTNTSLDISGSISQNNGYIYQF